MKRVLGMAAIALAVAATAPVAGAQDLGVTRAFRIGLQGGVSMPLGDFGDENAFGAETGFNVGASIGFKPAVLPVGLQLDVAYNRFGMSDAIFEAEPGLEGVDVDANWNVISGTANIVADMPGAVVRPYLIGGVGMYKYEIKATAEGTSVSFDDTDFGLNGGIGLRFPLGTMSAKLEARYHRIFVEDESISFLPISFGIEF